MPLTTGHVLTATGPVTKEFVAPDVAGLATDVALAAHAATAHGGSHPDLAAHDTLGLTTDALLAAHAAGAHGNSAHAIDGALHTGASVLPTAGQKNALAGTSGTPGSGNAYVTDQDARNTNARTPVSHSHVDADIPAAIARDSEVVGIVLAHEAAADPHAGYQKESEKAVASGYASLDAASKVPIAQVPTGTSGTTVALGNHVHPGDPTIVKLSTEQISAVTTFADITGFTRAIAAGECVYFKAFIGYRANAITTGIRLGVNGPASPTRLFYRTTTTRTNAAQSAAGATDNEGTFNANTYDAPAADSGVAATGVDYVATIEGVIFNGANAGTLAMRFASEVAVAAGITMARGSHVMFWTI